MLRRIAPAVLATAVIAVGLTGCSSADAQTVDRGECSAPFGTGAVSESVTVLGGFGTAPEVSIPQDTSVTATQRTIVDSSGVEGTPAIVGDDAFVTARVALYDQKSGEELFSDFAGDASRIFGNTPQHQDPIAAATECVAVGERVVVALSPEDTMLVGGSPESAVIAVIDVEATSGTRAEGRAKGLPNGFPAVVTDETGQPGVVLPPRAPKDGSTAAVRIEGTGAKVNADNTVLLQMLVVSWDGTSLVNTWASSGPQPVPGEEQAAAQGLQFREALTGKRVGSQVVITEGGEDGRVLVVDILAAA